MMFDIDNTYNVIYKDIEFINSSKNPLNRRLDFSAYFLALIQVLEKQGESYDQIKEVCFDVTKEYIRPKNTLQKLAKRLPAKLINTIPRQYNPENNG